MISAIVFQPHGYNHAPGGRNHNQSLKVKERATHIIERGMIR